MIRQTETHKRAQASGIVQTQTYILVCRALDLALDLARPTVLDRRQQWTTNE